jgi:pimeloyl-ACP methyl ester carboxylesterase
MNPTVSDAKNYADEVSAYAAAKISRYEIEDATIAVRVFGKGPALVLIHGFPVHGYTWRKLLPALSEQFTCYVVDLPGLGDSGWSSSTDFSFTAQARRLGLLLESMKLFRYSLLAHDTGATIARLVAIAQRDRVRKLVMINTEIPGQRPPGVWLYRKIQRLPGASAIFSMLLRRSWFIRSSMREFYSELRLLDDPSYIEPYVKPLITSPKRMDGALGYLCGIEWEVVDRMRHAHAEIKAETLFLWGEDDKTFPVQLAEEMCSQLNTQTTFVRIKKASLMPHEEKPEIVLKHLIPFLNS